MILLVVPCVMAGKVRSHVLMHACCSGGVAKERPVLLFYV